MLDKQRFYVLESALLYRLRFIFRYSAWTTNAEQPLVQVALQSARQVVSEQHRLRTRASREVGKCIFLPPGHPGIRKSVHLDATGNHDSCICKLGARNVLTGNLHFDELKP